ncbi:hypothetical protein F4824DRAFT_498175 [Ustulina deusta]|nr:hypothetical protein F4824DRAFT_498175 [Ustulina deusta]
MLLMLLVSLALFLFTPARAAETVQDDWWTSALQSWFHYYCPDCNPTSVDLWVTSPSDQQQHKIASGVDVTSTLSIAWTATVPTTELSDSRAWVLRFVPSGEDPSSIDQEISSSVFIITNPDAASSSSTPVSSPTTGGTPPASTNPTMTTSAATSTEMMITSATVTTEAMTTNAAASTKTTTSAAVSTETTTTPQSSSGLSTGARADIGVGTGVGAIVLFALGWCLARHQGSKGSTPAPSGTGSRNLVSNLPPQTYYPPPFEADSSLPYSG